MTLYMVIETFRPGRKAAVYERYAGGGRMLPGGLEYLDSWVEEGGDRCFQLMKTDRRELLLEWIEKWSDLVEFEECVGFDPLLGETDERLEHVVTCVAQRLDRSQRRGRRVVDLVCETGREFAERHQRLALTCRRIHPAHRLIDGIENVSAER